MKHSLFAIEFLMPLGGSVRHELLQADLHKHIVASPERPSYADKHRFFGDLVRFVKRAEPEFHLGVWDYTNDPAEADREWEEWTEGTVRDFSGERPRPVAGERRYMFLTLAFLLERKSETDRALEKKCTVPEARLWQRSTFYRLLEAIPQLDFQRVQSDAVFLCPGNLAHGLTEEELQSGAYSYYRPIQEG